MDGSVVAAAISGFGAVVTVAGTLYAAIRSGKDKQDRRADRTVAEKTAEQIEAEKSDIVDQTRSRLLQDINKQLDQAKCEAEANRKEAERYRREAYALREELAEEKTRSARVIRRLTRRAETLEEWIENNHQRFHELGIDGLPIDLLKDRRPRADEEHDDED